MYADDHGRQVKSRPLANYPPAPAASLEERFRQAKARLSIAQEKRMEAGVEFLAARAALRGWMEEVWPGQEGEEQGGEKSKAESARCPASRTSW